MRRSLLVAMLTLSLSAALAAPPGFVMNLDAAKQECRDTGKLVFLYCHLDG